MSRQLTRVRCLTAVALALFVFQTAHAQSSDSLLERFSLSCYRMGVHVQTEDNGGQSFTDARLYAPFGDEELMIFADTRLLAGSDSNVGYNLGGGVRGTVGPEFMWGGNLFADRRVTDFGSYNQIGFGWEAVLNGVEVRNNFYHPLGTDRYVVSENVIAQGITPGTEPFFRQNFLSAQFTNSIFQQFEQALRGFDFEAGGVIYANDIAAVRGYVGGYYFENPGANDNIPGLSARLNLIVGDYIEANGAVQHDEYFGTNGIVGLTLYLDGANCEGNVSDQIRRVISRPVYRRQMVTVAQGSLMRTEDIGVVNLTNAETGDALTIAHVDSNAAAGGDGTFENPFNQLPVTQPTDIVYLYSGSTFDAQSYTLLANQRLLGEGGFTHLVDTVELGTLALPDGNGGGLKPVISNSAGYAVTMTNGSEVANLSIVNPVDGGILSSGTTDALINSVMISTSLNDSEGIFAENSTNLQIVTSMIQTSGDAEGIVASNGGTVTVDNSSIMIGGSAGIFADGIDELNVLNGSTITTNADFSDGISALNGGSVTVDNSSIMTSGAFAHGIDAEGIDEINLLNGSTITTNTMDDFAFGIRASTIGVVTVDNSSIMTSAPRSLGIETFMVDELNVHGSTITTMGDDADGIAATLTGIVTINNTSIETSGDSTDGIFANSVDELNVLNGSTVSVSGNNSNALRYLGSEITTTNTLNLMDSVFNAVDGDSVFVGVNDATAVIDINATILGNAGDNRLFLNNTGLGTFNIFGATNLMDLSSVVNDFAAEAEAGTINYMP